MDALIPGRKRKPKSPSLWNKNMHLVFVKLCMNEARHGNKPSSCFNKAGYEKLIKNIKKKTGKDFTYKQLKNHWENMKKDWKLYDRLMTLESGIRWDPIRKTIDASEEWWDDKIKVNKDLAKFRGKNLEMYKLYYDPLFRDTVAVEDKSKLPLDCRLVDEDEEHQEGKGDSDDMNAYDDEEGKETITDTTEASNVMKDKTHKIKPVCPESINMVQTLMPCQAASMPSKSLTEMNGKRKRNCEQDKETITDTTEASKMMKDKTHKIKPVSPESINMVLTLRPCQAASMPSKSVTEMNEKRKRNGEQDKETITDTTEASKMMKDKTHKIKPVSPESINMVQTLRPCQAASMPSKSVTEMNEKRKRNCEQDKETITDTTEASKAMKDKTHKIKPVSPESINMVQTLRPCQAASTPSKSVTEMNGRNGEQGKETITDTTEASKVMKEKTHKLKPVCPESMNMVQTLRPCQAASMPSKSVAEMNGRNGEQMLDAVPINFSCPQSGIICVQGYNVKNIYAPILDAIFKKHGDIAAKCVFPNAAARASLLEAVCELVGRIETYDVTNIISEMEEIQSQLSVAEVAKIDVTWLRSYLEANHKMNEAQKKSTSLMETKTILVKMAAETDLKGSYDEFVAARNRWVKAQKFVKVLGLVEEKLNNNLLESEAEKDFWARKRIM